MTTIEQDLTVAPEASETDPAPAEAKTAKAKPAKSTAKAKPAKSAAKPAKSEPKEPKEKVAPLTLTQRKKIHAIAKAGAKGVTVKGDFANRPFQHLVNHGLASVKSTDSEKGTTYQVTDKGKARAKQVNAKYAV